MPGSSGMRCATAASASRSTRRTRSSDTRFASGRPKRSRTFWSSGKPRPPRGPLTSTSAGSRRNGRSRSTLALLLSACNMLTLNSGTANAPNSIFSSSAAPILTTATAGMLQAAKYFAIQLQNVGQNGTVDIPNISAISTSRYDVVAIDEITTSNSALKLNTVAIVNQIHATAGTALSHKILLAYVDIGEAENYRTYWQTAWTS